MMKTLPVSEQETVRILERFRRSWKFYPVHPQKI